MATWLLINLHSKRALVSWGDVRATTLRDSRTSSHYTAYPVATSMERASSLEEIGELMPMVPKPAQINISPVSVMQHAAPKAQDGRGPPSLSSPSPVPPSVADLFEQHVLAQLMELAQAELRKQQPPQQPQQPIDAEALVPPKKRKHTEVS